LEFNRTISYYDIPNEATLQFRFRDKAGYDFFLYMLISPNKEIDNNKKGKEIPNEEKGEDTETPVLTKEEMEAEDKALRETSIEAKHEPKEHAFIAQLVNLRIENY
jgi:hypothetical protein